jgi:guanosine-3',5'-bis(diphosphate) 3'-pyrophosphohydrolase
MENWYTFEERIKEYSQIDRWNTHSAYWFAKYGHRGQHRQGGEQRRYFEHVREVAIICIDELNLNVPYVVQSALLHDILEDTGVLGNPTRLERQEWEKETKYRLSINFGVDVARIVRSLTHVGLSSDYYEQLLNSDPDALVVKMCDSTHNLRTMEDLPRHKIIRKTTEYREKYYPIFKKLVGTEYESHYRYLIGQMEDQIYGLFQSGGLA